ncbi:efflux RND transporter permease subunit [Flavitalea sp. BT771]|uniref:efflux RND transporter permease subunit n=1 Tax=Flavitalea sp. BT771 TaxID=3063329 RepID=UPI0026E255B4|nr:efflux RND transporter permease subunit [Flavitalea sp. BT771]MDO6430636.1 efflux RND transporter permease subunit [Flavitalea sp. BT771]MDV6219224.1 efflux RND transporter permease subunit [Flavitalea sp. BT771]
MFNIFIKRPVLSLVISLIIVLLGILALVTLPVTQFPDIVPPSVTVTANYTGANAQVCAKAVAIPLERAINGVPGMTYMSTVCSNDGLTVINIYFNVDVDPDRAAVSVQNRVATVIDELPEEVIRAGVTTEKEVNSMLMYLNIMSTDSTLDEKFIYNFTDINILQELKRIEGVGLVEIMGAKEYSMRVWLKPDRMASYKISTDEVIEAIRNQNVEAAPGKTGLSSDRSPQALQYVLRYTGKFYEPEQYENIVVRADHNGSVLRLKEIADVEFGSLTYSMVSNTDGRPSASIMIKQRPGSNAREVISSIKEKMAELKKISFPAGMSYNINYDVSRFLDASIHEVLRTLVEAFILVFIVVYIFLQDFRSTLIPALAVPVALIGTLFFMQMLGFSINLLTLFALVLAIGIVVDNAIVVVEAVHVKMQEEHMNAMDATVSAMKEISGAIVAITLVMSAVFVPVAFMSGPVGVFYRQFSLTLAFAIVISGINAVTLTPALCAILLKHTSSTGKKSLQQRLFMGFNRRYEALSRRYTGLIGRIAARRLVTISLLLAFFVAAWGFNAILPSGFIPTEDQGQILVNVTTPPGSTVERTEAVLAEVQRRTKNISSIESVSTLSGYSLVTEVAGASYGMAMINLKDWSERKESLKEVIHQLERKTHDIADASIQFFPPPTVPGFGNASGFEIQLLDRTGGENLDRTAGIGNKFIKDLNQSPEIEGAFSSFDPTFPQYMISVDQAVAAQKGISIFRAMETLQSLVGSYYTSNFIRFGQLYKVMIQASPEYRSRPEDVLRMQIKNDKGEMVPFATFIKMDRIQGPEQITRYNMYTAAMITGDAATGYSSGDAINSIRRAGEQLPKGYSFAWSGMTREQILSGNQAIFIFLICLLFVYLLLAAQYESFLLPMPVILSLPTGIFGAFFFLKVTGLENNIYAQVALVMLIGLLGKNAILIVEFAVQRQKQGIAILMAAVEGARSRLRPILMTSFAFIAGLIPLCIASGAGAMGNRSIGTAAAGGMLFGTIFGLILIPGLYVIFATIGARKKKPKVTPAVALVLLAVMLAPGCTSYKAVTITPKQDLPATYAGGTDSTDIAALTPAKFFSDPYLLDLIDTALAANPDLQSALQKIEVAGANLQNSRSSLLPALNAEIGAALRKYSDYTMDGVGNFDTNLSPDINKDQRIPNPTPDYFLGFRSAWEVDLWGRLRSRKAAALSRFLASREGYRMVVTELVSQVATLYYKLLALDRQQRIVRKNIQLQENALEIVKAQKLGGRATELAVQQFQAQLLHTRGLLYTTSQEITESETGLNFLLGGYTRKIDRDTSIASLPLPATLPAGIPSQLLLHRPDVREAEAQLLAVNADIRAARAAFFPSLNLSAYTGYNAFKTALLFNPGSIAYGLTGGLTAPIFNRRAIKADYTHSIAEGRQALYAYQRTILTSFREVTNSLKGIENYSRFYELKQGEVASLNNAVSVANDLYLVGRASYLEVITAQRNVLDAELDMTNAKASVFLHAVNLYRSVGGGWR